MKLSVLHLNIERDNHTDAVVHLLEEKKPDVVCFEEAMLREVKIMASKLGYEWAFTPMVAIKEDKEGPAILSRFPIQKTKEYRYDDNKSEELPRRAKDDVLSKGDKRPEDRFQYFSTLLAVFLKCPDNSLVTVATTHFPVTDHSTPGLHDHEFNNINEVGEIEYTRGYLDRLIPIIRELNEPIIFTADVNNTRGEYVYDALAHELIDIVPQTLVSSIDPTLHRKPNLKLMVDTIMVSPSVSVKNFEVIEGVSDHKAFFTTLDFLS